MDVAECKKNFQKRIQQRIMANEKLHHTIVQKSIPLIVDWFQKNPDLCNPCLSNLINSDNDFYHLKSIWVFHR